MPDSSAEGRLKSAPAGIATLGANSGQWLIEGESPLTMFHGLGCISSSPPAQLQKNCGIFLMFFQARVPIPPTLLERKAR